MNENPLKQLVAKQKANQPIGIYSACSANKYVIEAVIKRGKQDNSCVLIESTANQSDQFGGYTGMKPIDFRNFVLDVAKQYDFDERKLFLGGDHLGPLTWTHLNEKEAMKNAEDLITHYVMAGFTKIHIDTSMKVADDDPNERLSDEVIAKRGVYLASVAEAAYKELLKENPNAVQPIYIVGSEVPIPGGVQGDGEGMQVTRVEDFKATEAVFEKAFKETGLESAWQQVIGFVVQPGIEEKDAGCTEYDRKKAKDLMASIDEYPNLIFEGHSSDYQTKEKLKELVEDGVGILKVGPGLTFMVREALFALAHIEEELFYNTDVKTSNFINVLDEVMLEDPSRWQKYYTGSENEIRIKRKYSFSDRSRYYMQNDKVEASIRVLVENLKDGIPLNLLSQFMPIQYTKVREGLLDNNPEDLIRDRVINTIDEYLYATKQKELF
ncbi:MULTISPECIES: class II D-tagatose-bisphosphate aldolase, non-catalytic subunit [unclassified Breznakia]|uniref:class II D-tagatose-bisphosphate aldolase, non-catalytic subunit n=1 Tax=unclassified Breznakia TaxID=2623764 RepID=UPI002406B007|nr:MULTISPECIES: class II D-tagatose-bisphosphate aldolase, non-catalytic subunit [unclassified Breznakia]MDF9838746.1 D-tagatose-1,6-bisphosphate aldolase subunit GatZ/KbaZ [Breznakia sp. PFB2-8]MDF9860766.1 D-tagatose-1,6-bisphosphate aldolase subunit GatZ/KbaZ [Breznakia sp. PH5-24]